MKILLVGEYSGFHNSLKKGLIELGHEVTLLASGDGFKGYPADIKVDAYLFRNKFVLRKIKNLIFRIFNIDLAGLELLFRIKKHTKNLAPFDVIQFINSNCFLTKPSIEKKIFLHLSKLSKNRYLHGGGNDVYWTNYMLNKHKGYSSLTPYIKDPSLKPHFLTALKYTQKAYKNYYAFFLNNISGIIPSDMDYQIVYKNTVKAFEMIPCPIKINELNFEPIVIGEQIKIFCGINTTNQHAKGIPYFLEALAIIEKKYGKKVEIKITRNLPYKEYIKIYDEAHIFLDQCLSYDQGYNGREAMAKGKVVFSGANDDFRTFYNISEAHMPLIEAKPEVAYLVSKLSELIEDPKKIHLLSKRARLFIEKEHHYMEIAKKYLNTWGLS